MNLCPDFALFEKKTNAARAHGRNKKERERERKKKNTLRPKEHHRCTYTIQKDENRIEIERL